ncbi:MAG: matrixin family metalloprotease [Balneolales bacterium]
MNKYLSILAGLLVIVLLCFRPWLPDFTGKPAGGPCAWPLTYSIEHLDPRFGINAAQLSSALDDVERIWAGPFNQPVLSRTENGQVKVSILFDERQQRSIDQKRVTDQLGQDRRSYEHMVSRRKMLNDRFELENRQYQTDNRKLDQRVGEHNRKITRWNREGNIPDDVIEELETEQKELDRLRARIFSAGKELEKLVDETNALTDRINRFIGETNALADDFNETFVNNDPIRQGEYASQADQRSINIYQFSDLNKLRFVLAHEFGHALGIGHVDSSNSVMYEMTSDDNTTGELRLTRQDREAFLAVCEN